MIVSTNRQRLTWVLCIFAFVHIAHIAAFWPYSTVAATASEQWRNGVIVVHFALLAFVAVVLPVKHLLERHPHKNQRALDAMPALAGTVFLLCGATLAIIDQHVTTAINPLLMSAIGVALVIVMRPLVTLLMYTSALTLFVIGVAWVQPNPDLLLTIRVNAITATGIGFGLALIQWRNQLLALRQQQRIDEQQRELEAKNQALTILATRDALTGLMNRAEFGRQAAQEIAEMQRSGVPACLAMVDVDHFKLINDTYGHPAGDSVLVAVAGVLARQLRRTDILGRMGGEEFAILLPGCSKGDGVQLAESLRAAIAQRPIVIGDQTVPVTASFGVTEVPSECSDALEQAYRAADQALYWAKNDGRNRVRSVQRQDIA